MSIAPVLHDMGEWESVEFPGVALSDEDRELVDYLGHPRGRLIVDELRTGLRVVSRSWVGVVHLSGLDIRIQPKLTGGIPGLLRMLVFASGLGALWRRMDKQWLDPKRETDLLDLLALLLTIATDQIVAAGLLHDYVEEEAGLPVVRGRLLVDRQIRQRMGRIDRLECRYDDRSSDILENQILVAALGICSRRVADPPVLASSRRLHALFSTVCTLTGFDHRAAFERITYHRLNQHYQQAHELARFILDGFGLEDPLQIGRLRSFAFLIDMNLLFERFVHRFTEQLLKGRGYRVRYLHHDRSILWQAGRPYGTVVPDLLVETIPPGLCRLPVDAKYKAYDEQRLNSADIYQSFLYAFAFNGLGPEVPQALLVYPTRQDSIRTSQLEIRNAAGRPGARIQTLGIHLPEALTEATNGGVGPVSSALLEALEVAAGTAAGSRLGGG